MARNFIQQSEWHSILFGVQDICGRVTNDSRSAVSLICEKSHCLSLNDSECNIRSNILDRNNRCKEEICECFQRRVFYKKYSKHPSFSLEIDIIPSSREKYLETGRMCCYLDKRELCRCYDCLIYASM